jgi:hypothetical protein
MIEKACSHAGAGADWSAGGVLPRSDPILSWQVGLKLTDLAK